MSDTQPPSDSSHPSSSGMPSMPAYQETARGPAASKPSAIVNAVRVMYLGALLSVIGIVVTFTSKSTIRDNARETLVKGGKAFSNSDVDTAVNIALVGGVVGGLIGAALWLWMAWKNGQGRKWARVLSTVLAAINVISTIFVVSGNAASVSKLLSVLNLIIGVVALVLLYLRPSSEYYNAQSVPR